MRDIQRDQERVSDPLGRKVQAAVNPLTWVLGATL